MTQERSSRIFGTWHVENIHIIHVDVDCLVATNQFFIWARWVIASQNIHIDITNIKIVLDHSHEFKCLWIIKSKLDEVKANFIKTLVAEKIKFLCFRVIDYFKYRVYFKQLVQINLLMGIQIYPNTISARSNNESGLVDIWQKVVWLAEQCRLKLVDDHNSLGDVIKFEYAFHLGEDYGVGICTLPWIFKVIFHANFVKFSEILDDYPFGNLERVIVQWIFRLDSLKYEQLVLFLLVHHKILPTDDCEPIFIFGFL